MIIAFDTALHKTGYVVYDEIRNKIMEQATMRAIDVIDVYKQTKYILQSYQYMRDVYIIQEAMPMQFGKSTHIKTLKALTQAHTAITIAATECNIDELPEIYPVTIKKACGVDKTIKIDSKDQVAEFVCNYFQTTDNGDRDQTDALGLLYTFLIKLQNPNKEENT